MAVSLQTLIDRSVKNMGSGIHPVVKTTMLEVISRAYAEGVYVQVSSGYRSNAEQQKLFNQGRTTPGNIVTHARPGQSLHNYGLAVDYFLVSQDGTKGIWVVNDAWRRVAAIGKSLGFAWGGDWAGWKDHPHLEMTGGLSLSQLQAGKRPSLSLKFKPGAVQSGISGQDVKRLQKDLLQLGYKLPKFGADGDYGAETEKAVKAFQLANGLAVDGIAGKKTLEAIKKQIEGELTVSQYNELKKLIDSQAKEIAALKKKKQNVIPASTAVDPAHEEKWKWAKENGLVDGSNPAGNVTRQQLGSVEHNFYKQFIANDAVAEEYAEEALKWADERDVSDGSNPAHLASRQQVIAITHRAVEAVLEDVQQMIEKAMKTEELKTSGDENKSVEETK